MPDQKPVRNANTTVVQQSETIFKQETDPEKQKQEHHFVRQDKDRAPRDRIGTPQPGPRDQVMRSQKANSSFERLQNKSVPKRKTEHVSMWADPILKSQIQNEALKEGLSISATLAAIARKHFETEAHLRYSAYMEPVFERIIDKKLKARDAAIIALLVRLAFDSGQTRSIVTNILGLQPDISPELLRDIIAESDKRAKSNIIKKTPQISELTAAIEKWFFEQKKEEHSNN